MQSLVWGEITPTTFDSLSEADRWFQDVRESCPDPLGSWWHDSPLTFLEVLRTRFGGPHQIP
jgi:hypothetical protein